MKLTKTTVAGAAAATFMAASALPETSTTFHLAMQLTAAIAIAALGKVAKDCPTACPGTDEDGRPRAANRWLYLPLIGTIMLVVFATWLVGCTSPNPSHNPKDPLSQAYTVNPKLAIYSNAVSEITTTAGTVSGTGPLLPLAASGVMLTITALSALWARHKSETARVLAEGVTAAGPAAVAQVLQSASESTKFAAVASALNQQAPPGQAPGTPPK